MTATPTVSGASTVTPAATPTPAPAPNYSAGSYKQPTSNAPVATVPAQPAMMPSNMSATGNPVASPTSEPVAAAPAPSTPGVKGSRVYNTLGSLGDVLMQQQAAAAGISQPDFTKYNPYGDKRAEASKAAAPLISQLARAEQANWNKSIADALKQYKVASQKLLPTPARQALQTSLTNRINQTLLQNSLGKDPGKLSSYVDDDNQQEAAAQVAKLQAAKQKILNFDTPANTAAQTQAWQDIAQATYDMRSLLQFHPKGFNDSRMPRVKSDANGVLYVGKTPISNSQIGADIKYLLDSKTINGMPPKITKLPSGQFALNDDYILDPTEPAERELIRIIQTQPA